MATKVRPGDQVAVFTVCGGRLRRGLKGRVERVSCHVDRGERILVLLKNPTRDGFAVLEVRPTEVVRLSQETSK